MAEKNTKKKAEKVEQPRQRRTKEEIAEALQKKIEFHQQQADQIKEKMGAKLKYHTDAIEKLSAKKEKVLTVRAKAPRKKGVNAIIAKAKENGMTPEEIAEKLGIEI